MGERLKKSLSKLSEELSGYLFEPPENAAKRIRTEREKLRSLRLADKMRTFEYAKPITQEEKKEADIVMEERENFFSTITLLMDRQPDDEVRYDLLCLLCEIGAIEKDFYASTKQQSGVGDRYGFGKMALQTLLDVMPSVVNIREPFVDAVRDCLIEIIGNNDDYGAGMDRMYVIAVLPILLDMCRDPKFGFEVADCFENITLKLVEVFEFSRKLVRYGVVTANKPTGVVVNLEGTSDEDETDPFFRRSGPITMPVLPRAAFSQICSLMAICAANNVLTASNYHRQTISDQLAIEKLTLIKRRDIPDAYCAECAVHELMASMARHNEDAAQHFTSAERPFYIIESIVRDVKMISDVTRAHTQKKKAAEHQARHDALLVSVLNSILMSSDKACKFITDSPEVNENSFVTNYLKAASKGSAMLTSAALDGLVMITNSPSLASFKSVMETECDLVPQLQEIMKNLLVNIKSWNDASREGMISSLLLMKIYSQVPAISAQLNDPVLEGYDREAITFMLLQSKDVQVTDDVKQAAAEVMRVVSLAEFDKGEIRQVVDMLAAVPALVSMKTYDVMTNLIFLLFKMAMDTGGGDGDEESCGQTFRDIYATEVVSSVFGNISRAMDGDLANTVHSVDPRKRRFETASVKFLQTAWKQVELQQGMFSDVALETLVKVIVTEQALLQNARVKAFHYHEHLFIEQTPVGFHPNHLIKCIKALQQRDIVAFRCFHQLANIIAGVEPSQFLNELERASKDDSDPNKESFQKWAEMLCGVDIEVLASTEMSHWGYKMNLLQTKYPWRHATVKDASAMADVQAMYAERMYKIVKEAETMKDRWSQTLKESIQYEPKIVHLVLEDTTPDGTVLVGYCGGGPLRDLEAKEANPRQCELYSMAIHNDYSGEFEMLQRAMLMVFSHEMSVRGFQTAQAWVHENEQVLYASSETKWLNQFDDVSSDSDMKRSSKLKPYLYSWDLSNNIWKRNMAHRDFLDQSGIETLVHFLTKADDVPFTQYDPALIDLTMQSSIRQKMEDYGQVLMTILEKNKGGGSESIHIDDEDPNPFEGNHPEEDVRDFRFKLEEVFKAKTWVSAQTLLHPPTWDSQLRGTEEENFIQTVTLGLTGAALEDNVKVVIEEKIDELRRLYDERPADFPKSKYMDIQLKPCIAAMLRSFYILLKGGSHKTRERVLTALREPTTFHALRMVLAAEGYGIRENIDQVLVDQYGVALKFLQVSEAIMYAHPKDLNESMLAIELYELMCQTVQHMLSRITDLLRSRDVGGEDPLHTVRALYRYEELVIAKVCHLASELVNQVASIQFFSGSATIPLIYDGNRMCRQHALKQLFANAGFEKAFVAILLYDQELSTGLHEKPQPQAIATQRLEETAELIVDEGKLGVSQTAGYYRDSFRLSILDTLGKLVSFNKTFRYKFIEEFNRSLVEAGVGTRPSFMQLVLTTSQAKEFRVHLEQALLKHNNIFKEGEVIVDHTFVESKSLGNYKLVMMTNEAWYISKGSFASDEPNHKLVNMRDYVYFHKYNYQSVTKVWRGYLPHSQLLSVEHEVDGEVVVEVLICRTIGATDRLIQCFERYRYDDLGQPISVSMEKPNYVLQKEREDFVANAPRGTTPPAKELPCFTERAVMSAFHRAGIETWSQKAERRKHRELLFTYCRMGTSVGGNLQDRVLVWSAAGDKQILVELDVDLSKWTAYPTNKTREKSGRAEMNKHDPNVTSFLSVVKHYDINKNLHSVEFTESPTPIMVLSFKKKSESLFVSKNLETVSVHFKCDTAREQWRRQLKDNLPGNKDDWKTNTLPDLYFNDRTSGKFL